MAGQEVGMDRNHERNPTKVSAGNAVLTYADRLVTFCAELGEILLCRIKHQISYDWHGAVIQLDWPAGVATGKK
jgi:hypothetical protein